MHIGGNSGSGEIVAVVLTETSVSDDAVVKEMLEQIEETLLSCASDGVYDKRKVYEALSAHSVPPASPIPKIAMSMITGDSFHATGRDIKISLKDRACCPQRANQLLALPLFDVIMAISYANFS